MTDPYANAPGHYKHPNDRTSIWEGLKPHAASAEQVSREYPRHLYKPGAATDEDPEPAPLVLEVGSDEARDAALADGWSLTP